MIARGCVALRYLEASYKYNDDNVRQQLARRRIQHSKTCAITARAPGGLQAVLDEGIKESDFAPPVQTVLRVLHALQGGLDLRSHLLPRRERDGAVPHPLLSVHGRVRRRVCGGRLGPVEETVAAPGRAGGLVTAAMYQKTSGVWNSLRCQALF